MEASHIKDLTIEFAPTVGGDFIDSDVHWHVSLDAFANLFGSGALLTATKLTVDTGARQIRNKILVTLPYILSKMPRLESLVIEHLFDDLGSEFDFDFSHFPKVKSRTLRSLVLRCCDDEEFLSFISLFSECPIDELDVDMDEPCLKELSEYFPELKTLAYYRCADLEVLLTPKGDGEFAFPKLEAVTLWGFDSRNRCIEDAFKGLQARDRNLILQIAIVRLFSPKSAPLKHISIDTCIMDGQEYQDDFYDADFSKELEKYVPEIDWMELH